MNFNNFSCLVFWDENVLIPPNLKVSQGAKCFNTPKFYITDFHIYNLNLRKTAVNGTVEFACLYVCMWVCISQVTPYYLKLYFGVGVLWKHLFLEYFCMMASISSIKKSLNQLLEILSKIISLCVKSEGKRTQA